MGSNRKSIAVTQMPYSNPDIISAQDAKNDCEKYSNLVLNRLDLRSCPDEESRLALQPSLIKTYGSLPTTSREDWHALFGMQWWVFSTQDNRDGFSLPDKAIEARDIATLCGIASAGEKLHIVQELIRCCKEAKQYKISIPARSSSYRGIWQRACSSMKNQLDRRIPAISHQAYHAIHSLAFERPIDALGKDLFGGGYTFRRSVPRMEIDTTTPIKTHLMSVHHLSDKQADHILQHFNGAFRNQIGAFEKDQEALHTFVQRMETWHQNINSTEETQTIRMGAFLKDLVDFVPSTDHAQSRSQYFAIRAKHRS